MDDLFELTQRYYRNFYEERGPLAALEAYIDPGVVWRIDGQELDFKAVKERAVALREEVCDIRCTLSGPEQEGDVLTFSLTFSGARHDGSALEIGPMRVRCRFADGKVVEARGVDEDKVHTVVIGAGFAGLEASLRLEAAGIPHLVVERGHETFGPWRRERWASFKMNTPHWSNRLHGQEDDVDPETTAMPVARCLELWDAHIARSGLPLAFGREVTRVLRLAPTRSGARFAVEWSAHDGRRGRILARNVIACTGALQRPVIPPLASRLPEGVRSLDIASYKRPEELAPGAVLVVGAGQTGAQLAEELLLAGRCVYMATSLMAGLPRSLRGMDIITLLKLLGVTASTKENTPEERIYGKPPTVGADRALSYHHLARLGATLLGRLEDISEDGGCATFSGDLPDNIAFSDRTYDEMVASLGAATREHPAFKDVPPAAREPEYEPCEALLRYAPSAPRSLDLAEAGITNVLWACGLSASFPWLDIPEVRARFGKRDRPIDPCGPDVPGFYWLGFSFERTMASNFLFGFGEDAEWVVGKIHAEERGPSTRKRPPLL